MLATGFRHDASSRANACTSPTRRSRRSAQTGDTASDLSRRLRTAPSFRAILRNVAARAAGLDVWVALASNACALATRFAISEPVFASISPGPHTSAAPSCRNRHASPSVPAAGVDTQPRTGSQTSTVQASSSAHSSSLVHGAGRVDVLVELVDVVVVDVLVGLVDVVVDEVVVVVVVGRVVVLVEVVDVVGVEAMVEAVNVEAAATASRRPKPLASSKLGAPMSTAPRVSAACTSAGVSVGSWSRSSAATPAECGAAADVPKNAQKGGHAGNPPAFEIATPSNATRSGLARSSCVGKSIRAGPCELNGSTVWRPGSCTSTAPTATTDDNAACPKMLPAAEPCSSADAPRQKSSRRRGAPANRLTRTLASWSVLVWFTTWTISIGSCAPTWRSVLAAMRFRLASKRARS